MTFLETIEQVRALPPSTLQDDLRARSMEIVTAFYEERIAYALSRMDAYMSPEQRRRALLKYVARSRRWLKTQLRRAGSRATAREAYEHAAREASLLERWNAETKLLYGSRVRVTNGKHKNRFGVVMNHGQDVDSGRVLLGLDEAPHVKSELARVPRGFVRIVAAPLSAPPEAFDADGRLSLDDLWKNYGTHARGHGPGWFTMVGGGHRGT